LLASFVALPVEASEDDALAIDSIAESARTPDRPERVPYREGQPVPEGYHLEESPRWDLVAGGTTVLATLWSISSVSAVVLDREDTDDGDPNFDDMYWPMFIPVAGPFATIKTSDASGTGAAILALDGAVQTLGLGLLIAGFAAPKTELVSDDEWTIAPSLSRDGGGLELGGTF
jgi:hypothetical protein